MSSNINGPALSPDYGIISAAVTLMVGLLIFLTIDWRLDVRGLIWRSNPTSDGGGQIQGRTNIPNLLVKVTLIATFILAGASILSALFPEYLGIILAAKARA